MNIFDKFRDFQEIASFKLGNVKEAVDDMKDFVEDKSFDAKYFVKSRSRSVKNTIQYKANINSKTDAIEFASNVLFPINLIFSHVGKDAASTIRIKNNHLTKCVNTLELCQEESRKLDQKLKKQLSNITNHKETIYKTLQTFTEVFEKIHNTPTYNLNLNGQEISFQELFKQANTGADFAMFDSYLFKIYDKDAGMIYGLLRSPAFAAILKFREKTITSKIDNVVQEVEECIENMKIVNCHMKELSKIAEIFEKELNAFQTEFSTHVESLGHLVDAKDDFEHFTDDEIQLLDVTIKTVQIIVSLLNTHLFEENEPNEDGLIPINKKEISKVVKESAALRKSI